MKPLDTIRTSLIDKILTIQNMDFLKALDNLVSTSSLTEEVKLTDEQIWMLQRSEDDISESRTISQDNLDQQDIEWLRKK